MHLEKDLNLLIISRKLATFLDQIVIVCVCVCVFKLLNLNKVREEGKDGAVSCMSDGVSLATIVRVPKWRACRWSR